MKTKEDNQDTSCKIEKILKVGSKTNSKSLGNVIASLIRDNKEVSLLCVGAGAINQGIKGITIAKGDLAIYGIYPLVDPCFTKIETTEFGDTSAITLNLIY